VLDHALAERWLGGEPGLVMEDDLPAAGAQPCSPWAPRAGELDVGTTCDLRAALRDAFAEAAATVLIDLEALAFIDVTACLSSGPVRQLTAS
jgi:hypothetical protein